ncbi:hypothetical protein GCM10009840_01320 [Pseudolysinimonas kribbensis]|uniref:HTTM-like domain-containing protein n=1 Tax=Pseudolysinimonas kribbensis TaxID=433641 RepID=A0ABQ6K1D5_9MICO|nr:HTTM domain-containing protein [Pseudolysinimonas kribbensis]GMA94406.1 hypothetical protein GCM10025881_12300 [Pseudolysinimonas kribbensis]
MSTEVDTDQPAGDEATPSEREPRGFIGRTLDTTLSWVLGSKHASYSWAMFRITYGVIVLIVLAGSWADRQYLWGVGSRFIDPVADNRGYPWFFEAIFIKSNVVVFDVAYYLLAALAVLFVIGWRTRWVAPFLLLFWIGLEVNSTLLTNGGDTIMRVTLLFALFADMTQHWSLDSWLRRRRPRRAAVASSWAPAWAGNLLHNTALVLCLWQILLVYATSALLKFQGLEWKNGTATYYSLVLDVFRPYPWLSQLVTAWDVPVHLLTYATMGLQLLFPVFLVWRPTRIVALIGVTGVHLGIGLFLGLWPFSLAMIAVDFLFVRDETWRWFIGLVRPYLARLRSRLPVGSRPAAVGAPD